MTITWSLIKLVFSGGISADISGSIVSGALTVTASRGTVVSVTGTVVVQTAGGEEYQVGVSVFWLLGAYTGHVTVSGPGIHTTATITGSVTAAGGLVSGQARGTSGNAPYTLSFTL